MKVLVTGAAGNIGRATCRGLIEAGYQVRGTDQRFDAEVTPDLHVADLRRYTDVYALLRGMDAVVHLGNYPNVRASVPPQVVYAENTAMNIHVFQAALEVGVRRVVFASSIQAVSGDREAGQGRPSGLKYLPLDGEAPHNPSNLYGLSKVTGELMLRYLAERTTDLRATALRFPHVVADGSGWRPSQPPRGLRPETRLDEGFSYLMRSDAVRLIQAVLERQGPGYHAYLPAAETPSVPIPVPDLLRDYFPGVELRRPVGEMTGLVDNSAITRDLGWRPLGRLALEGAQPGAPAR